MNEENDAQTVTVKEISTTWDCLRAEVGRSPENRRRGGNSKSGTFCLLHLRNSCLRLPTHPPDSDFAHVSSWPKIRDIENNSVTINAQGHGALTMLLVPSSSDG